MIFLMKMILKKKDHYEYIINSKVLKIKIMRNLRILIVDFP